MSENEAEFGFCDLVPERAVEHLGDLEMTFNGRLPRALKIREDGGESGCGGKIWIAGELLCKYILAKGFLGYKKCVEIGSGTGLVGLCCGIMEQREKDLEVYITDIDNLVPLMEKNIVENKVEDCVKARELWWGEPLPDFCEGSDIVLAADCVYLEKAFPILEKTLLDLTNGEKIPRVLMSYRKRRKADKNFFKKIKKSFDVVEITDFEEYDEYLKQRTHLFELVRRRN